MKHSVQRGGLQPSRQYLVPGQRSPNRRCPPTGAATLQEPSFWSERSGWPCLLPTGASGSMITSASPLHQPRFIRRGITPDSAVDAAEAEVFDLEELVDAVMRALAADAALLHAAERGDLGRD